MKKRLLSGILSLVMVVSLLPGLSVSVLAEENADDLKPITAETYAELGLSQDTSSYEEKIENSAKPYGNGNYSIKTVNELFVNYRTDDYKIGAYAFDNTQIATTNTTSSEKFSPYGGTHGSDSNYGSLTGNNYVSSHSGGVDSFCSCAVTKAFDPSGSGKDDHVAKLGISMGTTTASMYLFIGQHTTNEYVTNRATINIVDFPREYLPDIKHELGGRYGERWEFDAIMEIATGDFDGDGHEEIAVYNPVYNKIEFYVYNAAKMEITKKNTYISLPSFSIADGYKLRYLTVSMATEDFAFDFSDELIVGISGNYGQKFSKVISQFGSFLRVYDMNETLEAEPQKVYDQYLAWDQSDGYDLGSDKMVMRYVNVAAGDVDNDGEAEIVAAGYRGLSCWNDGYGLDNDHALCTIVDFNRDHVDTTIGTFASAVDGLAYDVVLAEDDLMSISRYNDEKGVADHYFLPPIALAVAATNGSNFSERVFIGGRVFEWKSSGQYNGNGAQGMGHSTAAGCFEKIMRINESADGKTANYISSITVGNFNGNKYGQEQIIYTYVMKNDRGTIVELGSVASNSATESNSNFANTRERVYYEDDGGLKPVYFDACAVDYDDDSCIMRMTGREITYTNPTVLTVLQAAPWFEDLAALDDNYSSSGSTSSGNYETIGAGAQAGATIGGSVTIEFEQQISEPFCGITLAEAKGCWQSEAGVGYDYSYMHTWERGINYTANSSQDSVVVVTLPELLYHYEMWIPPVRLSTVDYVYSWYINNFLEEFYDGSQQNGIKWDEMSRQEKEKCYNEMTALYPMGSTIPGFWKQVVVRSQLDVVSAILPVETYDSIAEKTEGMQPIRGTVLFNTPGDPASYNRAPSKQAFKSEETVAGYSTVTISDSSITRDFSEEDAHDHSFFGYLNFSESMGFGAGGMCLSLGMTQSITAGVLVSHSAGSNYSGTVSNLPQGSEGYSFDWSFGYSVENINGNDVPVMLYHVKNVVRPPSLPKNFEVEQVTPDSVRLTWERGATSAPKYEVFYYDTVYNRSYLIALLGGEIFEYTHKGLESGTRYTYTIRASNGQGFNSVMSVPITARTTAAAGQGPTYAAQPQDVTIYPNGIAEFSVNVNGVSTLGNVFYQWQENSGDGWKDIPNSFSSTYSLQASKKLAGTRYRCIAYQWNKGTPMEIVSAPAELKIERAQSTTTVSSNADDIINTASTVKLIADTTADIDNDVTGNVTFKVANLSNAAYSENFTVDLADARTGCDWVVPSSGVYEVTAEYAGNSILKSSEATTSFTALKENEHVLGISAENITYGDTPIFRTLFDGVEVTDGVTYKINGKETSAEPLTVGRYSVSASYTYGGMHYTASTEFSVSAKIIAIQKSVGFSEEGENISTECEWVGTSTPIENDIASLLGMFEAKVIEGYQEDGKTAVYADNSTSIGTYPSVIVANEGVSEAVKDKYNLVLQENPYHIIAPVYDGILTYSTSVGGTISAPVQSGESINSQDAITLTATPNAGYRVAEWIVKVGDNEPSVTTGDLRNFTFTLTEDAPIDINVTFDEDYYTVNFGATAGGTAELDVPLSSGGSVLSGTKLKFTARPKNGYIFRGWRLSDSESYISTEPVYTHSVLADTDLVAEFVAESEISRYTVNVSSTGGNGSVTPLGAQPVNEGGNLTVSAETTINNCIFTGWTVTGLGTATYTLTDNPLNISNITYDGAVTANYISMIKNPVVYGATVASASANGQAFASGANINVGSRIVFVANIPEGKYVQSWFVNGIEQSGQAGTTLELIHSVGISDVSVNFGDCSTLSSPIITEIGDDYVQIASPTEQNATIFFAAYSGNKLLKIDAQRNVTITSGQKSYEPSSAFSSLGASRLKAMLWENAESMIPICKSKSSGISIQ